MAKYKAYPEYKESGVEWLGEIPISWSIVRHKYCASYTKGKNPNELMDDLEEGLYPYLSMDFLRGKAQPLYAALSSSLHIVSEGQPLIIWDGSNSGEFVKGQQGILSSTMAAASLKTANINPNFYWYLCISIEQQIRKYAIGMGIPHVDGEKLRTIYLPISSLEEQEKIANFLDHETAKIDTLIEKQEKLIELLQEKRQAVISHAVTKGLDSSVAMKDSGVEWLGEVPKHWVPIKLKFLAELNPSKSEVIFDTQSICSFVPMDKLKFDHLTLDEERFIKDVYEGYTYFKDGDILIAKVTPCFENKNMAIARELSNGIGFGSSEIYVLRPKHKKLVEYLYFRLQETIFMEMAVSEMSGAGGLKRIPSAFLQNFQFYYPSCNFELVEIVNFIKTQSLIYQRLIEQAVVSIELLKERRTALISAAVTGKIDVRNVELV